MDNVDAIFLVIAPNFTILSKACGIGQYKFLRIVKYMLLGFLENTNSQLIYATMVKNNSGMVPGAVQLPSSAEIEIIIEYKKNTK